MLGVVALVVGCVVGTVHHRPAESFVGPPAERLEMSPFEPSVFVEPRRPHWWQSPLVVNQPWRHSVEHIGLRGFRGTLDAELGWRSTMGVPLLTFTLGER